MMKKLIIFLMAVLLPLSAFEMSADEKEARKIPLRTGVVEDLMDNDGLTSHSSVRYSENVSGFTIREIEKSIEGATTWNGWRDNIISMYPYNPSISNVKSLFTVW